MRKPKPLITRARARSLFITEVENITFTKHLGRGEKVGDRFLITNDTKFVRELITPLLTTLAGSLETHYLQKANAVAYCIEDSISVSDHAEAVALLNTRIGWVRQFLHALWFVKDNAANVDMGYLEWPYRTSWGNVTRNSFVFRFSRADGSMDGTEFSREELRRARVLFAKQSFADVDFDVQSALVEDVGRWERAFYFLQAARANSDLGVKIVTYCTCFENTLFNRQSGAIA